MLKLKNLKKKTTIFLNKFIKKPKKVNTQFIKNLNLTHLISFKVEAHFTQRRKKIPLIPWRYISQTIFLVDFFNNKKKLLNNKKNQKKGILRTPTNQTQ